MSFKVVAPNVSSTKGVSRGHEASTSGLGWGAFEGGVDAAQPIRRVVAVAVHRDLADRFLDLLTDHDMLHLHLRDRPG